jgi:putative transposase
VMTGVAMRELVRGMCGDWAVSIRAECGAIGFGRSTLHVIPRQSGPIRAASSSPGTWT